MVAHSFASDGTAALAGVVFSSDKLAVASWPGTLHAASRTAVVAVDTLFCMDVVAFSSDTPVFVYTRLTRWTNPYQLEPDCQARPPEPQRTILCLTTFSFFHESFLIRRK